MDMKPSLANACEAMASLLFQPLLVAVRPCQLVGLTLAWSFLLVFCSKDSRKMHH